MRVLKTTADRLANYKLTEVGCWEWAGAKNYGGYGLINYRVDGKLKMGAAHRVSYMHHVGEIPPGHVVLHKCDNPCCINPDHLRTGTQRDNIIDLHAKGRRAATNDRAKLLRALVPIVDPAEMLLHETVDDARARLSARLPDDEWRRRAASARNSA